MSIYEAKEEYLMNQEREQHLDRIKKSFLEEVDKKYRTGQAEHGGDLAELLPLNLIKNAMDEAVDEYVYLYTLKEQLENKDNNLYGE